MTVKDLIPESSSIIALGILMLAYQMYSGPALDTAQDATQNLGSSDETFHLTGLSNQLVIASDSVIASQLQLIRFDDASLEKQVGHLLQTRAFKQTRTTLLELAAKALEDGDNRQLVNVLLLLGETATNEQEVDIAEIYLLEALDIAMFLGDETMMARSYRQLGHLHIKARELARSASTAYDNLWLARNQIYRGEYRMARENLEQVIDSSLSTRRFGAAASAYQTLSRFHRKFHDDYLAEQAASESARLYAYSGQITRARAITQNLSEAGLADSAISDLDNEVSQLYGQHLEDIAQTAKARDYQMLYRYYKNRGEINKAWKLRILASKSLANTSARSMYQKRPDVLAILYNSNFSMNKAKNYLDRASNLFAAQGDHELSVNVQNMKTLIY